MDSTMDQSHDYRSMTHSDFYEVINKWLADRNSLDRIYRANSDNDAWTKFDVTNHGNTFGLIVLSEQQRAYWPDDILLLSLENHDNRYNSISLSKAIQSFDSVGLFSHLSSDEKEKANGQQIYRYSDLLQCFPDVVHVFDMETGNLENPYEELCNAFARISRGTFAPSNIKDDFAENFQNPKKKVIFSFEWKGRKYSKQLANNGDWLDPEFLTLIRQALRENDVDAGFYDCYDGGQETGFIFLTKDQHQFVQKRYPELLQQE
jgi:hypothetical protein